MTSSNVQRVSIINGNVVIVENDGTTTTNGKASLTDALVLLKSTDSSLDVRKQVHAALKLIGFTGTLGNFGG